MLDRNPAAEQAHILGLEAKFAGDYAAAHEHFRQGSQALEAEPQSLWVAVQTARIMRDDAWTFLREALAAHNQQRDWRTRLAASDIGLNVSASIFMATELAGVPEEHSAEFSTEQGATLGLLGRLATAAAILGDPDAVHDGTTQYRLARAYLRQGSNGYYRTSNAINALRHNRLYGTAGAMFSDAVEVVRSLAWTRRHDPEHWADAQQTVNSRIGRLVTKAAARQSVLDHP